ncbi:hypothetical protein BDM02DRAFT_3122811, partial [Thelephora ganbajun]
MDLRTRLDVVTLFRVSLERFPQPPPFLQSPDYPRSDNTRLSSLPQMSPSSVDPPEWFCTCRKCGTRGKVLSRATWYRHNPGGIKAKYGTLSDKEMESIERICAVPRPAYKTRKRNSCKKGAKVEETPGTPESVAGSSSNVLIGAGDTQRHQTDPEIGQYPQPTSLFESKDEIQPPFSAR